LPTPTTQDNSGTCRNHGGDLLHELICGCPRADRKNLELLRTPVASEAEGGAVAPDVAKANGQTLRLSGQMIDMVAPDQLPKLPTPIATDYKNGKSSAGYGLNLSETARSLLPTPVASEGTKAPSQQTSATKSKTGQVWLSNVAKDLEQTDVKRSQINWGKFEPAIRRWEAIIGRQAPDPTKPDGKDGNHRLSSKFTEWMMGLPDGWITDIGLKRNDELKACGNGVVPQQAELALSLLGIKEILERS